MFSIPGHRSHPSFCKKVIKGQTEVDCLINNTAVQRPLYINDFDLGSGDQDIDINIRGPMAFDDPILGAIQGERCGYSYQHFELAGLAKDVKGKKIKIVEITPLTVATNLHRNPDDITKDKNPDSLKLGEYMDFVKQGFEEDKETVGAGPNFEIVERWSTEFAGDHQKAASG
ncbi:short chain dehydrogenase [Marssonina coronariae]|uniref:Short chain dehydrogenase n=1 Tax=Diplocarpon coronariae TaxID=2795749 RepID=A0A218ZHI5_9HELO|nr:short chain dehydrogenase [Marssonina coronariae]